MRPGPSERVDTLELVLALNASAWAAVDEFLGACERAGWKPEHQVWCRDFMARKVRHTPPDEPLEAHQTEMVRLWVTIRALAETKLYREHTPEALAPLERYLREMDEALGE